MPNHCSNYLYVYGPLEERKLFLEKSLGGDLLDLDLNSFVPIVETKDNYWGHVASWGTKWNCYETDIDEREEYIRIYFQTAWCPYNPEVQKAMSEKFKTLKFKLLFVERGVSFQGYYLSEYSDRTKTVKFSKNEGDCDIHKDCTDACESDCEDHEEYLKDAEYNELYQTSG